MCLTQMPLLLSPEVVMGTIVDAVLESISDAVHDAMPEIDLASSFRKEITSHSPVLSDFNREPPQYAGSFFQQAADDIARQVSERIAPQVAALERMADSFEQRVSIAERDLERAEKDSRAASVRSWIAIVISVIALAAPYVMPAALEWFSRLMQ